MKKIRQKKVLGSLIGGIVNGGFQLATTALNNNAQKEMQAKNIAAQQKMLLTQIDAQNNMANNNMAMAFLNNMNQQNNQNMSAQYNRFNTILKMGGKRVKKCKLGTFKDRF